MELRFVGQHMDRGAIPLRFLAKIADPLHKLLSASAYHIRHGKDFSHGLPASWNSILDLRLAAIGYGSTRLFLTGNVTPDLAGDSALQDGLNEIFNLLNAKSEDLFYSIHRIGPAAARGLTDFLIEVEKEQTAAEFSWTAPDDAQKRWEGRLDEIIRLRAILESTTETATTINEQLVGIVTLLSDTGRVDIVPDGSSAKIRITYPKSCHEWVAGVSLHQRIHVDVEKTTCFDRTSETEKSTYSLTGPVSKVS